MNWAQIGWWATDSTHVYEFAQFTTQPDAPNTAAHVGQWLNTAPGTMIQGSRHQYMVLENNTSGYFTFFVDGTLAFAAVGSGAFSYFPADDAEAAAEIHTLASQMAGGNSYPDDFSGTWWWLPGPSNWEPYYTGTYSSATLSPGQYSAFNHGIIASTEAQISDSACPS